MGSTGTIIAAKIPINTLRDCGFFVCCILAIVSACQPATEQGPVSPRLPHELSARCGDTGVFSDSSRLLIDSLGYPVGESLTSLSPSNALALCALSEPPLEEGDSVIRLLVSPGWWNHGMHYVVRIQARGKRTQVEARVLAVCLYDSLLSQAPRVWDAELGDTLIMIRDITTLGAVEYQQSALASRRLFNQTLRYLDDSDFWRSPGVLSHLDGGGTTVEVQLGEAYRAVQYADAPSHAGGWLPMIAAGGLLDIHCPSMVPGGVYWDWPVNRDRRW